MSQRNHLRFFGIALFMATFFVITGCSTGDGSTVVTPGTERTIDAVDMQPYLIGFINAPGPAHEAIVRAHQGTIGHTYNIVPAIAAVLPSRAVDALSRNPQIAYIEPDGTAEAIGLDTVPWGITRVKADQVWDLGNTGEGVTIAIIDTGIDYTHIDLASNYQGGYDWVNDDNDPMDDAGHGTHCAGIAAAAMNDVDVVGVAPDTYLVSLKVLDAGGSGYYSDMTAAIEWSVNNDIDIASMSLGGTYNSRTLRNACRAAYRAGLLVVAAAGNNGNPDGQGDNVLFPARYDSVIAVASIDQNNVRVWYSSTGSAVELAAPGLSIESDMLGGGTTFKSGTSMACPHVSGVAALVIASGITDAASVRDRLTSTAVDLGVPGVDTWYGYGLIEALAAVSGSPPPPPPPPPPESTGDIAGKVLNANTGRAINGATITADTGEFDNTNPSGRYTLEDLTPGLHYVTASASGYEDLMLEIEVIENTTVNQNFDLVPG